MISKCKSHFQNFYPNCRAAKGAAMSGSETGVMTSITREPFPITLQPVVQNMRLTFTADGTATYKPITAATSPSYQPSSTAAGGGGIEVSAGGPPISPHGINISMGSGGDTMKRKRGRPRKYGPDGSMSLALAPATQSGNVNQPSGSGISSPPPPPPAAATSAPAVTSPLPPGGSISPTGIKKSRGRPAGSSKKQQLEALAGFGFAPHVITVKAGEDVSTKIMSFSRHGPRAVCILSANGAISNVTLRQPSTSGGTVTYEGRFEILSLSGSFMPSENGGQRSRTGGLSVSLSGPDGRVIGGGVAGLLTALSPVQVVVASFLSDDQKESKSANQIESLSAISGLTPAVGTTGPNSPPSRGTLSESSGGHGSPLNQSTGACNNNHPQGISSMPWK
ncbi:AT-hook motif nuclear-localized protein 10 isoform X2 [Jatropha curcas]|uniref:AT-hook motif nuclear-localized protein 10 isoform X2 n=1 Tax=Jatropha curcas TaxID=180498 RepID=UPI0005FBA735|nr:AT-hook motif nuclear-localized protein 10 isoform X2 [Jatropha curcas]